MVCFYHSQLPCSKTEIYHGHKPTCIIFAIIGLLFSVYNLSSRSTWPSVLCKDDFPDPILGDTAAEGARNSTYIIMSA